MSNTGHINMVNLQVLPQEQIAADQAAGTYDANIAANPAYYNWNQCSFPFEPQGMAGDATGFVAQLKAAMPGVNTIRIPFNENLFDAQGTLYAPYKAFLEAAVDAGFQIVVTYATGEAQQTGISGDMTGQQIHDVLDGSMIANATTAYTNLLNYLDANPAVKAGFYGIELMNEPASYMFGAQYGGTQQQFVELYVKHVTQLAELIDARFDGKILVDAYRYAGSFAELAQTQIDGKSALDHIREAAGDSLVWSAHLYPGWVPGHVVSLDAWRQFFDDAYGVLGDDDILLTETNGHGGMVDSITGGNDFDMVRAYEALAERGIGMGWFPAANTGDSSFLTTRKNGNFVITHANSLAYALNGFSMDEEDAAHAAGEAVTSQVITTRMWAKGEPPPEGLAYAFGYGGNDTLHGRDGASDMLYGGSGDDLLLGYGQNDWLFGQYGNDTLRGGAGDDVLLGGAGDDLLDGGTGSDTLTGGDGADSFVFASDSGSIIITDYHSGQGDRIWWNGVRYHAAEVLSGGRWIDADRDGFADDYRVTRDGTTVTFLSVTMENLRGVLPSDGIVSGNGVTIDLEYRDPRDLDQVTMGDDIVRTGDGDDIIYTYSGNDQIFAGNGANLVYGGHGNDTIMAGSGNDTLYGERGDDFIAAGAGDDLVLGGPGNDTLEGGLGNDTLRGGDGDDFITDESGANVLNGDAGNDTIIGGTGADKIDGGGHDDVLHGGGGNDHIFGRWGNDRLMGEAGNDTLDGGVDDDYLDGGDGNDWLYGGQGQDTLIGGAGNDRLFGGQGDDYIDGGAGNDTIDGGMGDDTIIGGGGADSIQGGAGNDLIISGPDGSRIAGGDGDDRIEVDINAAVTHDLYGYSGKDTFVIRGAGDRGNAVIHDFKIGEDKLLFGADMTLGAAVASGRVLGYDLSDTFGVELVLGGGGRVTLKYITQSDFAKAFGVPFLGQTIVGTDGADRIIGSAYADDITGGWGDDYIEGGAGRDIIRAGGGNDTVLGGDGNDTIYGQGGNNLLRGGSGDDEIRSGSGSSRLFGDAGNDRLIAVGGNGAQHELTGGGGADVFEFMDRANGASVVTITDFAPADRLVIDGSSDLDALAARGVIEGVFRDGADVVIDLNLGDSIRLLNYHASDPLHLF